MKIKLVIEKQDMFIEVPITAKELRDIYDYGYEFDQEFIKLNGYEGCYTLHNKLMHIIHDIIDDGKCRTSKAEKWSICFLVKKPKWKKRCKKYDKS